MAPLVAKVIKPVLDAVVELLEEGDVRATAPHVSIASAGMPPWRDSLSILRFAASQSASSSTIGGTSPSGAGSGGGTSSE